MTKKYVSKRKPMFRRRRYARRTGRYATKIYRFKRARYAQGNIVCVGDQINLGAQTFTLSQLPNATEFTQLYDQYKITGIKFEIIPTYNVNAVAQVTDDTASNLYLIPTVHTVLDFDDHQAPANLEELMQYQNLKTTRGNVIHKRYWKPKAIAVLQNTTGTPLEFARGLSNEWIDCGNPNVLHYGLKWAIMPHTSAPDTIVKYDVKVTYYMIFKNVR